MSSIAVVVFCPGRELLAGRRLVACLHGHRSQDLSPWALAAQSCLDIAEDVGCPRVAGEVKLWWHIGGHSFSPYGSCFKPLSCRDEHQRSGVHEILFEALGVTLNSLIL